MKKITFLILIGLTISLLWYLFIRSYDLKSSFKLNTTPGTISQMVKSLNRSYNNWELIEQNSIYHYKQQVKIKEDTYLLEWDVRLLNDSVSQVNVFIKQPGHEVLNRLKIPFTSTTIKKNAAAIFKEVYRKTKSHIENFKVKVVGKSHFEKTYCIYIPLKTSQQGKAFGMMGNYSFLSLFIIENKLEINGVPFVEVTEWDCKKDEIQ